MAKRERGRPLNYEAYKRDYKAKARKLNANGAQMNQRMYTEDEFKLQYTRLLNQRKLDVSEGKRKTVGNVTRDLIDKQAFSLSTKQVEAMDESFRKGQNWYQLRAGYTLEEFEYEKTKEYMEKHPGADWDDALLYAYKAISTEMFGS